MGRLYADDLNEFGSELCISLETMLSIHLTSNHYPPVPTSLVGPCIEAIDAFNECDYDRDIKLPGAIQWKGQSHAPATALVENFHLESFISDPFDCDDIA